MHLQCYFMLPVYRYLYREHRIKPDFHRGAFFDFLEDSPASYPVEISEDVRCRFLFVGMIKQIGKSVSPSLSFMKEAWYLWMRPENFVSSMVWLVPMSVNGSPESSGDDFENLSRKNLRKFPKVPHTSRAAASRGPPGPGPREGSALRLLRVPRDRGVDALAAASQAGRD